jgi:hypothetical protein
MVKIKQIVSIFFVALFISYLAGTTLFSHTHIISGATFKFANFSSCFTLAPQQFQLFENKTIEEPYRVVSIHFQNFSLRAPPDWS